MKVRQSVVYPTFKYGEKLIIAAAPVRHTKNQIGFYLEQNMPNPFKSNTIIKYCVPYKSRVTVVITNSYGKVVDKLISATQEAGSYELKFSADGLPRGTYFYHVVADQFCDSREMEILR